VLLKPTSTECKEEEEPAPDLFITSASCVM
jgi:hypothetical protein